VTASRGSRSPRRSLSRLVVAALALAVVALIGLQYERIIERNLALARTLGAARADVGRLKMKRAEQRAELRRLSDPSGAIPEIHDRLHLTSSHEAIIYLKGVPAP
jgi:cell division protein FtsB